MNNCEKCSALEARLASVEKERDGLAKELQQIKTSPLQSALTVDGNLPVDTEETLLKTLQKPQSAKLSNVGMYQQIQELRSLCDRLASAVNEMECWCDYGDNKDKTCVRCQALAEYSKHSSIVE